MLTAAFMTFADYRVKPEYMEAVGPELSGSYPPLDWGAIDAPNTSPAGSHYLSPAVTPGLGPFVLPACVSRM